MRILKAHAQANKYTLSSPGKEVVALLLLLFKAPAALTVLGVTSELCLSSDDEHESKDGQHVAVSLSCIEMPSLNL